MRLRVDDISFESPCGLEDWTVYRFCANDPLLELEVKLEFPAGGGTSSEESITELRARLDGFPVAALVVGQAIDCELAGVAGHRLDFSFEDKGQTVHGSTLVANLGSEANAADWVEFSWSIGLGRADADAHIEAVRASLAPVSEVAPAPPAPDWIRRQAGPWAFDLPESLSVPRRYQWGSLDPRFALSIEVFELGADKPELDDALVEVSDDGFELVDREDIDLPEGGLVRAHMRHPEMEAQDGPEKLICRGVITHDLGEPPAPVHVQVDASGPWACASQLRTLVDDLLASIVLEVAP